MLLQQQFQSNSFGGDSFVRINPAFYLNNAINNAMGSLQAGLISGQKDQGFILLILNVDQLEKIAMARKILLDNDKEYSDKLVKYRELNNLEQSNLMDQAKLANYKLSLLLEKVFETLPRSTSYAMNLNKPLNFSPELPEEP